MSWRPHPRRASVNPSNPRAWGTSDRDGFVRNLEDMQWQYEWAGTQLINTGVLVGRDELDEPQEQLRAIKIPPDPDPVINARPEPYSMDEGLMPLTTEPAYGGDPGATVRSDDGNYIGIEP